MNTYIGPPPVFTQPQGKIQPKLSPSRKAPPLLTTPKVSYGQKVKPKVKPQVFKSFQDLAQHVEVVEEKKAEVKQQIRQRTKDRSRVEEVVKFNPHRVQARITWQGLTYLAFIDDEGNKVVRDLAGGGKPWDIDLFISSKNSSAEFRRLLSQAITILR
jgi:hypothetical protein